MGGCVSTIMNQRNAGSVQSHKIISGEYRPYGVEAVPVEGTEQENSSPIYRISNTTDAQHRKDTHDYYHGENWPHVVRSRCSETPDEPAFGYRIIERVEKRVTVDSKGREKTLEFYHCSSYKTISYAEVWTTLTALGRGFRALGLGDNANISIYEDTRWEWMVTMYGIWSQNMVSSTVYANLGEDALAYALGETNSEAIVCNGRTLTQLVQLLDTNDLHPIIIYLDDLPAGFDAGSHRVVSWKDVVARGNAPEVVEQYPIQMPTDNDAIALIMYTSGTTGDPKGVMHSHGSVAAGIRALNHRLIDLYRPNEDGGREIYCAYLPLAHILEFALTNIFVSRGTLVGFGNPRTLTDNFAIPHGDLREYKPRFIIAVPRIFDTIKKAVEAKLPPPGSFKRQIFDKAYQSRLDALQAGQETPYWNEKVFSAARAVLGGNIYGMLSGGGPLSSSTQEFINVVCGGPLLIQGWGLTETVCCGTTQRIGDLEPQCAGQLLISAEMRLFDTEEYKHTDSPEPRGEICLRGPFLFKGYYRQPELTAQALDSEGWFHTGDIGAITPEGKVRIVGRIKALAKNCLGEYIALETLEAVYSQCALSAVNGVCVLVHPDRPFIGALILTDEGRAMTFAKEHKIAGDYPEILSHPDFLAAAAAAFAATAKKAGRQSFELVKKVRVLDDLWTPENGLVTPTMKLRRTKVEEHYRALIEDIFQE